MKTYIGLVRDHSASMTNLKNGAISDYNLTINGIKESVHDEGQVAVISVVECGYGLLGKVRLVEENVPIERLCPISDYNTNGSATPLWDSVGAAIRSCQQAALVNGDHARDDVAFLIMVITDGQENHSKEWTASSLARHIRDLQTTDKWTFVFRVPRGYKQFLINLGIPDGNIMEWEQSEAALHQSTQATVAGVQTYFRNRSQGVRSSATFYVDATRLSNTNVKAALNEVNNFASAFVNPNETGKAIKDFCLERFGEYTPGKAFYQLTKPEKVQEYKQIVLREIENGKYFSGPMARQLLGLPYSGEIKVAPAKVGGRYEIFVQSTSYTRKLVGGTTVVYMNH